MDAKRFIVGLGSGRCGLRSLGAMLSRQPATTSTHMEWPLLAWPREGAKTQNRVNKRVARWRQARDSAVVADCASYYLPYVRDFLAQDIDIRFICLRRNREDVIASFCNWLDKVQPLPTNHWAARPTAGFFHDPIWSRIYPKYDEGDRATLVGRYWDEYNEQAESFEHENADRFRVFDTYSTLNSPEGQHALLSFAGYDSQQHALCPGLREHATQSARERIAPGTFASHEDDPKRCVILVPYTGFIVPGCEESLRKLEKRGYQVRRIGGYAAIDQGRNQMVTDALAEGYEETMWIDSDVVFEADAVERLRAHHVPICCGIYPQKGKQALACHVAMGADKITFGQQGGLSEILYAATGFLHVRREVYEQVQMRHDLPVCNERFRHPTIPFFQPMLHEIDDGYWYLAEDYAFSQRVRDCGYSIYADTSVRLWHVGTYSYGWEDAGMKAPRFDSFTLNFGDVPPEARKRSVEGESYAEEQKMRSEAGSESRFDER